MKLRILTIGLLFCTTQFSVAMTNTVIGYEISVIKYCNEKNKDFQGKVLLKKEIISSGTLTNIGLSISTKQFINVEFDSESISTAAHPLRNLLTNLIQTCPIVDDRFSKNNNSNVVNTQYCVRYDDKKKLIDAYIWNFDKGMRNEGTHYKLTDKLLHQNLLELIALLDEPILNK